MIQITVLVMTASQYFFTRKAGRIVRTPMVSLMLRDEISIFLLLSGSSTLLTRVQCVGR